MPAGAINSADFTQAFFPPEIRVDLSIVPLEEARFARLMRRDGLRHVEVCGGSGDLGVDVRAYTPDGRRVVVQCKRYSTTIGAMMFGST